MSLCGHDTLKKQAFSIFTKRTIAELPGCFVTLMQNPGAVSFIFDGDMHPTDSLNIHPDNRALRYGDGLFETLQVREGKLLLFPYHLERLTHGMGLLQLEATAGFFQTLEQQVLHLCSLNDCLSRARVRINVFRAEGKLFASALSPFHYLIEAFALSAAESAFNPQGLSAGLFGDVRKSCDKFSSLKSNSYLPFVMAARYASCHGWDDALVLNTYGRVAESAVANVFVIRGGVICTPPLSEGCVAGVMRRHLLHQLPRGGFRISERILSPEDVYGADELFLTNAIKGVRPVSQLDHKTYTMDKAREIHQLAERTLW
ncbi:MAG TPA: aminotransferase class IV [Chitinophagaceae bacterium]|nr:aminotransferase class IV [Chitinophagaceae bacterium]